MAKLVAFPYLPLIWIWTLIFNCAFGSNAAIICPYKCKDTLDLNKPVCGSKHGQKISYRNICWLECRGN